MLGYGLYLVSSRGVGALRETHVGGHVRKRIGLDDSDDSEIGVLCTVTATLDLSEVGKVEKLRRTLDDSSQLINIVFILRHTILRNLELAMRRLSRAISVGLAIPISTTHTHITRPGTHQIINNNLHQHLLPTLFLLFPGTSQVPIKHRYLRDGIEPRECRDFGDFEGIGGLGGVGHYGGSGGDFGGVERCEPDLE